MRYREDMNFIKGEDGYREGKEKGEREKAVADGGVKAQDPELRAQNEIRNDPALHSHRVKFKFLFSVVSTQF